MVLAGPLSVVALIAGWITTEVGRQPWIVYDVMRVDAAVTGAHEIPVGYGALCVVYLGLAGAVFWLLRRFSRVPLVARSRGRAAGRPAMLADVPMVFILIGITAYTVLSGADFGAGLWTLIPGGGQADAATTRDHTRHAIGPVWEANHVWLIFVLTVAWTCYPVAFGSIVSTLSIPLFIAAVGIIFRGTTYALRSQLERGEGRGVRAVENVFALSSVLTPFALATVIGAIATGRVPVGNARGNLVTSWLNPVSILAGVLAVAFSGYLAAVYLAADARRLAERSLVRRFPHPRAGRGCRRRRAGAGGPAGRPGAGPPALARAHVRASGWRMVCVCALAGVLTLILVWRDRFGPARASAALAVAAVIAGWAAAQEPRLLPGLTVEPGRGRPGHADRHDRRRRRRRGRPRALADPAVHPGPARPPRAGTPPPRRGREARKAAAGGVPASAGCRGGHPRLGGVHGFHGRGWPGGFAAVTLVAGAGLLVFARPGWAHGLGALSACGLRRHGLRAGRGAHPSRA